MENNSLENKNNKLYYISTILVVVYSVLSIPISIGIGKIIESSERYQNAVSIHPNNKVIDYTILIGWIVFILGIIINILLKNKVSKKQIIINGIIIFVITGVLQLSKTI